jgi:hypothetical protein
MAWYRDSFTFTLPGREYTASILKIQKLMLFGEIIAAYCEKYINHNYILETK